MNQTVEFPLGSGGNILIERISSDIPVDDFQMAGDGIQKRVVKATETFEAAILKIKPAVSAIANTFQSMSSDEIEIEFGLKLSAEADIIISSIATEVNFTVKLTWKKKQSGNNG